MLTGLQLLLSKRSFLLKVGVMSAFFKLFGNVPLTIHLLMSDVNTMEQISSFAFKIVGGISSF